MNSFLLLLLFFCRVTLAAETLTVVSANLTSGREQSYTPGHGQRILRAIPGDVFLLQEFKVGDNSDQTLRNFVDETFGSDFHVYREAYKVEEEGPIPNGIVSRFPILEAGEIDDPTQKNRDLVWARLKISKDQTLLVFSVHLGTSKSKREKAAQVLVRGAKKIRKPGELLIVAGDLNTDTRDERTLQILSEILTDQVVPTDEQGNSNTSKTRGRAYDYVLPDPKLNSYTTCTEILGRVFPEGAVMDTRVFSNVPAMKGARATDSAAKNMQHMAVIKTFKIP